MKVGEMLKLLHEDGWQAVENRTSGFRRDTPYPCHFVSTSTIQLAAEFASNRLTTVNP